MPDSHGFLLPEERRVLLHRFAPVLVLFPEDSRCAPYPDDGDAIYTIRGTYHPRAAEFFLKYARVRYRRRVVLWKPWLLFKPRPLAEEMARAEQSVRSQAVQQALADSPDDPRCVGLEGPALERAVRTHLVQQRLARRVRGFDLPIYRGFNLKQWNAYFERLAETDPATRRAAVYGRAVQGLAPLNREAVPEADLVRMSAYGPYDVSRTRLALQYWFHYVYDDWANRHEGDWESITLLLELDQAALTHGAPLDPETLLGYVTVQDVGYSSHEDGTRRLWADVQQTGEGRPVVYVARGSQASYFAWELDGYPTSAQVGFVERLLALPGRLLRGRRLFGRRWDVELQARFTGRDPKSTDWVAVDPQAADRLEGTGPNPVERLVPPGCRGVRRIPAFDPDAGQDETTYYLETDDIFWLEMVQEYGLQWGENSLLPGTQGPGGISKAARDSSRSAILCYARIEAAVHKALNQLIIAQIVAARAIPELDEALRPLRPNTLRKQRCLPRAIRPYLFRMWAAILREHPEAWPGGPGLYLRWVFARQAKEGPLLRRNDPIFHIKALLSEARRLRYELQHVGSKWDNPFAWVHYVCRADPIFYGKAPSQASQSFDLNRIDCADRDMSIL